MRSLLAIPFGEDGSLPTEFRLFVAGWNDTEHGRFLFDEEAAKAVMAAHAKWGVELAIDLEHQMLGGVEADPTARDARGWFTLELRADGSLWATNVKWTKDGAERLSERRQRYISPAFEVDSETKRVTKIINAAICSIPATHHTPALVAASAAGENAMTLEEFLKVVKALGIDMSSSLEEAMAKIKGEDSAKEDKPADPAPEASAAAPEAPAAKPEEDKPAEVAAALSSMMAEARTDSVVSLAARFKKALAAELTLATEIAKLAEREAILESAERRKLCVELVTLGGKAPATVWADPLAKEPAPKAYLLAMPIADLRAMHADEIKAKGGKTVSLAVTPPAPAETETLSAREREMLKGSSEEHVKAYLARKAAMKKAG